MGAIGLNPIRLDRIGLDPIRINAIKLGVPGAASDRPYIDPEVLASLKAVCICYGKSNDDPDRAVVKNLVDPDNPFVISNAAYKGMSGYNGYPNSFNDYTVVSGVTKTESSIKIEKELTGSGWFLYIPANTPVASMKLKIDGIPSNRVIKWNTNVEGIGDITLTNGVNEIPAYTSSAVSGIYTVYSNLKDFTITQIPSFEDAFVTDGIDDLITSTKTASEMGITNEVTVISMIHQIGGLNSSAVNYGYTNYFRGGDQSTLRNNATGLNKTGIYGYSATNYTPTVINNILGDKNDYTTSSAGFSQSTYGNVFSVVGYKTSDTIAETSSVAWYWTIIANKVLTIDQINQVIAYFNLDRTLKPDILCNTIKQGITNENHAEFGDKLIDFSGNGRDIQLNNIAWKGDSGIGKYNFSNINIISSNRFEGAVTTNKCHFTKKLTNTTNNFCDLVVISPNEPIKFKVSGLSDGRKLFIANKSGSGSNYNFDNGEHEVSLSFSEGVGQNNPFGVTGDIGDIDVTVEFIPSHAGALRLDGVSDFGKVTGMPIYKDFTVIANRRFIGAHLGAVISKSYAGNSGAFYFESGSSVASFGLITSLAVKEDIDISYLSKYVYKGDDIQSGTAVDSDEMWLGILRDNDPRFSNIAIYSLMSFPYSMSEFLIERQLKKHKLGTLYPDMVEFRPIVKSNLPYSSISYSVNPGEYISVDSMVTITVTLPNTSDKLMEVSCNAISDISISGDNGVYEITGKVVKSPQKINLVISSYLTMLSNSTLISNETLIKNE